MRAAIMSYCLRGVLRENDRSMDRIVTLAADEGFETLELYGGGWEVAGDLRKAAEELRRHADDRGVTLPVYGSGTRLGSIGVQREPNMKHLKVETEVCSILGGTVMTYPVVDGQPVPTDQPDAEVGIRFEKMLPVLVEQVQELADHACAFGVDIAVLNHCFLVYLGWHQRWLTRLSHRSNAGACVDPGNYLHYGHQDPVDVCRELSGVTKMVRAGNVVRRSEAEVVARFEASGEFSPWRATPLDAGQIDQAACYRNLAAGGYDGVVSLKNPGSSPDGPLTAIRQAWKTLNEQLKGLHGSK